MEHLLIPQLVLSTFSGQVHAGSRSAGFGDPEPEPMLSIFREIPMQDADDGVEFDLDALRVDRIPEGLDFPAPRLRAYARETVIAEKLQAMVMLGHGNTRMKD
jgi:hypothetical protein